MRKLMLTLFCVGALVASPIPVAGASSAPVRLTFDKVATGPGVWHGTVVSGYLRGAQVHEEGQLVNPATIEFAGSIRLMPATA